MALQLMVLHGHGMAAPAAAHMALLASTCRRGHAVAAPLQALYTY
jgi:hypothetical protein